MLYKEAIDYLYSLRLFGTKLGLENTFRLANLAGNPQERLRFIHVAGTNGKGSTCAMLESIYRAAGLKTGLFTSPHLVSFCERIQIDRNPIAESEVARLVSELRPLLQRFPSKAHPTFFEVVTIMALKYFQEQSCDIVIWETGLGGRLDATNIVTPLAAVITNVQFDHQEWLGDSLGKIALEKAGIIKSRIPVISAVDAPEALKIIEHTARERRASLRLVTGADLKSPLLSQIKLPLIGQHQRLNAALAVETVKTLQDMIPVSDSQIRFGLESVSWPGRLQLIVTPSGQKLLLDGAHNGAGATALRKALEEFFPAKPEALILGMLHDKDFHTICEILAPLSDSILVCPVDSKRTAAPELLAKVCMIANPGARVVTCSSLGDALNQTSAARFVLLAGSLYLVGEALELLGGAPSTSERALNEWSPAPAT